MINDYRKLNKTEDTVKSMDAQLKQMEKRLLAESKKLEHKAEHKAYQSWLKNSTKGAEAAQEAYLM